MAIGTGFSGESLAQPKSLKKKSGQVSPTKKKLPAKKAPIVRPDTAALSLSGEPGQIEQEAAELERKLKTAPRDEGVLQQRAELAVRSATGLEHALSAGDEALAASYRSLLAKRFPDMRWRMGRMADQADGRAAHALGVYALHGIVDPASVEEACKYFRRALDAGYSAAKFRAAQCLDEREPQRASALMKEAAASGNPWALEILGRNCLEATPPDGACAQQMLLGATASGRPSAQVLLAWTLAQGIGGQPDLPRAARLYQQAAEKGYPAAQNNLGELYESGRGVPADRKLAIEWYRKAAEAGFAPGQFNYGRALASGYGGLVDFPTARQWLLRAENSGIKEARTVLDWMNVNEREKAP